MIDAAPARPPRAATVRSGQMVSSGGKRRGDVRTNAGRSVDVSIPGRAELQLLVPAAGDSYVGSVSSNVDLMAQVSQAGTSRSTGAVLDLGSLPSANISAATITEATDAQELDEETADAGAAGGRGPSAASDCASVTTITSDGVADEMPGGRAAASAAAPAPQPTAGGGHMHPGAAGQSVRDVTGEAPLPSGLVPLGGSACDVRVFALSPRSG